MGLTPPSRFLSISNPTTCCAYRRILIAPGLITGRTSTNPFCLSAQPKQKSEWVWLAWVKCPAGFAVYVSLNLMRTLKNLIAASNYNKRCLGQNSSISKRRICQPVPAMAISLSHRRNRVGGGGYPPPLTPPDMRVRIRRFVKRQTIGGSVQRYFSVLASASRHCLGLHSLQVTWTSARSFSRLPRILAPFTAPALDCIGLRCLLSTRPAGTASYGVRVPQVAGLLPASFRPRLTATPLPSANGWCNTGPTAWRSAGQPP
jgi:hypothetical protein